MYIKITIAWFGFAKVDKLKSICNELKTVAEKNNAEIIILIQTGSELINYGCHAITDNFPPTLHPNERRTWVLLNEEKKIRRNILILGGNSEFWKTRINIISNIKQVKEKSNLYLHLVKNNRLNAIELLKKMKVKIREY